MLRVGKLLTKSSIRKGPSLSTKCNGNTPPKPTESKPTEPKPMQAKPTQPKPTTPKKMAIVLSGSGMLDGTEIHEASAVAVHLSKLEIEPLFYAPRCLQADVMDHVENSSTQELRCAFTESARIARGKIYNLCHLNSSKIDGVIFPGGLGPAKTLSTFASAGACCSVNEEVVRILNEFQASKKPMGFMCLSTILPARLFPGVKITLGKKGDDEKWPHSFAIDPVVEMGAELQDCEVGDFVVDNEKLIFSTPAFMYQGTFYEIFSGIGKMIENMSKSIQ